MRVTELTFSDGRSCLEDARNRHQAASLATWARELAWQENHH